MVKCIGKNFKVEPQHQDISLINELIRMNDFIDITDIVAELVAPKLLAALQQWLSHTKKNMNEIWVWYKGWKNFLMEHGGP